MGQFMHSLLLVFIGFSIMLGIGLLGIFDNVELEIGLEHYAEIPWLPSFPEIMPLNALINLGYIGLGLYWCRKISVSTKQGVLSGHDVRLFYTFNIMASLYGCVQMARIVTQGVIWSVLDQWCTLPFFSILLVWGLYYRYGWSSTRYGLIIFISICSYTLSLYSIIGFEICLLMHIVSALIGGILAYLKYPVPHSMFHFYSALLMCLGFVVLKLLDLKLASISIIFKYVSGHFLSKICDAGQIYFVDLFFYDLSLHKRDDDMLKLKQFGKYEKQHRVNSKNQHVDSHFTRKRI